MQGRQIRLNGEELKTKPVFCCLFPWKVERFCTLHKQARLQIQRKKHFLFFCNLRHGKQTHLHHFQTTKRQLKQRFAYQKVTTVWKNTLQRLVLRRHKRTANTVKTLAGFACCGIAPERHLLQYLRRCNLRQCTKQQIKQFDFYFQSALHHKQINSCALGQRKMPLYCLQTSCSKCIKP